MKRLDGYIRVSRRNGRSGDSYITKDQQRDKIEAFARVMGAEIIAWHVDEDQSGGTTDRPGLNAAMARIEAGDTGGLIVAKIDRFARAVDAYSTVRRILDREAIFASAAERLDPTTPMGKAMLQIVLVFGELELDRFRDNWADVQSRASERGVWIGPAPLGYRRDKRGALVADRNARHVREAFKLAASGGLYAAMAYLEQHVPSKRWRKSDVRRVLSNRAYLGEHHDGGVGHDAITTDDVFAAAQTEPRGRRSNSDYPLSHVAACANCGAGLVGGMQSVDGRRYRRMRCSAACGAGGVGSVSADKLEQHVREQVARKLASVRFRTSLIPTGQDDAAADVASAKWDLEQFLEGTAGLPAAQIRAGIDKRRAALEAAEREHRELASQSAQREELPGPGELGDPRKLAAALRVGVDGIVVWPGRGPIDRRVGVLFVGDHDFDQQAGTLAA